MPRASNRVLLIPRHMTFVGPLDYRSAPFWVRPFGSVHGVVWKNAGFAASGPIDLRLVLEGSQDLYLWTTIVTVDPNPGEEEPFDADLTFDWVRVKVEVTGTSSVVTAWAVADFMPRE